MTDSLLVDLLTADAGERPLLASGDPLTGANLTRVRQALIAADGYVLVKVIPKITSAVVIANRMRGYLGPAAVVTVDDNGFLYARLRRDHEPDKHANGKISFDPAVWMTLDEAAAALGISRQWVWGLSRSGDLHWRQAGIRRLYRRDEIELFAHRRRRKKARRNPGGSKHAR